jgi:phosphopantothenate synthetase
MSTAKIIYEQYKVLPKRIREELKALIVNEDNQEQPLTLMQEIEESLKQVKLIKDGKMPKKNMRDLLNG